MKFEQDVVEVLKKETLAYVATADSQGKPNISLKGVIDYDSDNGVLYFLDLFCWKTKENLTQNNKISLALIDHNGFHGYQFKGIAEMIEAGPEFDKHCLHWNIDKHSRYMERTSTSFRLMRKNDEKFSEYDLPKPKYLVKITVDEVVSLAPKAHPNQDYKK